jgi:hypothetical protein
MKAGDLFSLTARCADRIAGLELHAVADGEGDGLAVGADLPALGKAWLDAGFQVQRVEIDKLVVEVVDDVLARKLKALRRIHADDVVDLGCHDQRVGGRLGPACGRCRNDRGGQKQRAKRKTILHD